MWIHGGHPILPRSANIFEKQILISELCESVWPTSPKLLGHGNIISCLFRQRDFLVEIKWSWVFVVTVDDPIGFVSSDMRSCVLEGKISYLPFIH